jgi:hypothetical protein
MSPNVVTLVTWALGPALMLLGRPLGSWAGPWALFLGFWTFIGPFLGSWVFLGPLGSWAVGLLGRWALGPLGSWAVGLLGRWDLGLLGLSWALGPLGFWALGLLGPLALGPMGSWALGTCLLRCNYDDAAVFCQHCSSFKK